MRKLNIITIILLKLIRPTIPDVLQHWTHDFRYNPFKLNQFGFKRQVPPFRQDPSRRLRPHQPVRMNSRKILKESKKPVSESVWLFELCMRASSRTSDSHSGEGRSSSLPAYFIEVLTYCAWVILLPLVSWRCAHEQMTSSFHDQSRSPRWPKKTPGIPFNILTQSHIPAMNITVFRRSASEAQQYR